MAGRHHPVELLGHDLEVAADRRQGRAELVGDVGDEVVLGGVEGAQRRLDLGLDGQRPCLRVGQRVERLDDRAQLLRPVRAGTQGGVLDHQVHDALELHQRLGDLAEQPGPGSGDHQPRDQRQQRHRGDGAPQAPRRVGARLTHPVAERRCGGLVRLQHVAEEPLTDAVAAGLEGLGPAGGLHPRLGVLLDPRVDGVLLLGHQQGQGRVALGEGADLSLVPGQPGQQLVVLVDRRRIGAAGPVGDRALERGDVQQHVLVGGGRGLQVLGEGVDRARGEQHPDDGHDRHQHHQHRQPVQRRRHRARDRAAPQPRLHDVSPGSARP